MDGWIRKFISCLKFGSPCVLQNLCTVYFTDLLASCEKLHFSKHDVFFSLTSLWWDFSQAVPLNYYIFPCSFSCHVTSMVTLERWAANKLYCMFKVTELSKALWQKVQGQGHHNGKLGVTSHLKVEQLSLLMCWQLHTRQLLGFHAYMSQLASYLWWCKELDGDLCQENGILIRHIKVFYVFYLEAQTGDSVVLY